MALDTPSGAEGDPIHVETAKSPEEVAADVARAEAVIVAKDLVSRQFRKATIGYVLLAATIVFALYHTQSRQDAKLRHDINALARVGCVSGRGNVIKFNGFVDEIIQTRSATMLEHERLGQTKEAAIDRDAISRYKAKKLHVATDAECNRPIL